MGESRVTQKTKRLMNSVGSNCTSVLQYLYEGRNCGPNASSGVSGPGKQIRKGLLQAVGHLSSAQPYTWDQLA